MDNPSIHGDGKRTPITEKKLLLVEGDEEKVFFESFCKHFQIQGIQIWPYAGKIQLRKNLPTLIATPDFNQVQSIGIIRDADDNPSGAFESVRDILINSKLPSPKGPLESSSGGNLVTLILILPAADQKGCLENLCLSSVSDDPAIHCVEQYFQCLIQQGFPDQQNPNKLSKAKVHTFLSSRPEPDKRLGEAAQAGYWPFDHTIFNPVKEFLQRL